MRQQNRTALALWAAISALVITPISTFAATSTWNGGNNFTGNLMTTAGNWSGGVPVSGSSNLTLVFLNGTNNNPNQNIANPLSVQSMQFASSGTTLLGNPYQLDNLGAAPSISVTGINGAVFQTSVTFTSPGSVTQTGGTSLNMDTFNGAGITFSGTTSGSPATLNLGGTSPNALGGTLSVSGAYTINAQKPANVQALGGNITLQGLSPTQVTGLVLVNSNQLAGGSNVTVLSDSGMSILAPNILNNLEVTGVSANVNLTTSTLTVVGQISNNGGFSTIQNGSLNLNGGLKLINCSVANTQLTISSAISNGQITKTGAGNLVMTNSSNTFTGQTVVNAGTLVGTTTSLGTSVLDNSIVSLSSGTLTTNLISGSGLLKVSTITFAAAQSHTGGTDIGNQAFGDSSTLAGDFTSSTFGEMNFTQAVNGTYAGNLSGNLKLIKSGSGILKLTGNNIQTNVVSLVDGGFDFASSSPIGTGNLVTQTGATVSLQATGSVSMPNVPQFFATNNNFIGSGNLTFTDTSAKTLSTNLSHSSSGTTTIGGKFTLNSGSTLTVTGGNLVLGDASQLNAFTNNGTITLNAGTLTVQSLNFTTLTNVSLAGGTLNVPNGYALPIGNALVGKGGVTGRVSTANGSSVIASGTLTIGDGTHPAGVNLDGELYTSKFTVVLLDSNQAVLGSLTKLGNGPGIPGTVKAANGAVLNFGRNLDGNGTFDSINALATAVIVNGDVNGDSFSDPINFTGYVKGVGTFNNVMFGGTFSPGFSPALVTMGNVAFANSNVFEEEIGGLIRGSQYNALDITGTLTLNGQLKVTLLNGFNPSLGNVFNLIDGTTVGTFSSFSFPPLSPGLAWSTANLYTQGELQIVATPEPAAFVSISLAALASLKHRRRHVSYAR